MAGRIFLLNSPDLDKIDWWLNEYDHTFSFLIVILAQDLLSLFPLVKIQTRLYIILYIYIMYR